MPIRITAVALAAALGLLVAPAAAQGPPVPPGLPDDLDDLLPDADTARFKVTINGSQLARIDFVFNSAPAAPCALQATGVLNERWEYERGKSVVLVFRKLGPGVVVLQRAGRGLGDAALAAPGIVTRNASGAARAAFPDGSCRSFPLATADCGVAFPKRTDLSFSYAKGKLVLVQSAKENQRVNPALGCGETPIGNFDELPTRFPFLFKQKGRLKVKDLFESKRNIRLMLESNFLEPVDKPAGYTKLEEQIFSTTHVTLKRLK